MLVKEHSAFVLLIFKELGGSALNRRRSFLGTFMRLSDGN